MKSQYDIERKRFSDIEGLVKLPKYQRRLVWSKDQKENFIDNISKGYPFGSILLYRYKNADELSLIDGLQRYSAMIDFKDNPSKYFNNYGSFINEIVAEIKSLEDLELSANSEENIREKLDGIFKAYLMEPDPSPYYIRDAITKGADCISIYPTTEESLNKLLYVQGRLDKAVEDFLDLDDVIIPCIVFNGDESMLPDVFANLNRGGTKLSKYQVLAATLYSNTVKLPDDKIGSDLLDIVIERYIDLEKQRGLRIEGFDREEMLEERSINFPEFCYALGYRIAAEAPVFWQGTTDKDIEKREDLFNVIGYLSTAIALGVDNRKLDNLTNKMSLFEDHPKFISQFVDNILSIYKVLNEEFAKWLRIPGTSGTTHYESSTITDMQILSFFASLFHKKYRINSETCSIDVIANYRDSGFEQIRKNLISYCISDIATNVWQGSGDSRLASYYATDSDSRLSYYQKLDSSTIESRLLVWLDTVIDKSSINIEKVSRILLCLHANINTWQYDADEYDVEHIVSRQKLKANNAYLDGDIPGGTIGNLMYLKPKTNRGKQGNNLYAISDNEGVVFEKNYLEQMKYPDRKTIDNAEEQLAIGNYEPVKAFINSRAKDIIKTVSEKIVSSGL